MAVPNYNQIVVVMMENHDYNQIIGNTQAPYINSLAAGGALLTNYTAISHPSEPNYFSLYAGSTFGIADDNHYSEPDPTLATILQGAGKTFTGYVEGGASSYDHNPWESFPEGFSVEKDFSTFPSTANFAALPNVSFVIPNVNDDMHNGTIQQGDSWLQSNLNGYAQWAQNNNSLLVVVWDEGDISPNDQVAAIFYGAHVVPGDYSTSYNHYNMLSTLLAANNLTGPRNAATAAPINVFSGGTGTLSGQVTLSTATEDTALAAGTTVARFTDSNTADTTSGFRATITWGDGSSSAGVVSGANGSFTVSGGHTYADEGSFVLSTAITRTADNAKITPTGTVTATEDDVLTPHALTITGTVNQALTNVTVATFTDSDKANLAGDLGATIDWGDGTQGVGTVSGANGTFSVSGTHTYTAAGTDPIVVTLSDDTPGTATTTANSTAQISGGGGSGIGRTIGDSISGPIILSSADIPLTITSSGAVTSTGSGVDGIDGPTNRASTIANAGKVTSSGGIGISLTDGGTVTNAPGGSIAGLTVGVYGAYGVASAVTNAGDISGTGSNGAGVYLAGGGDITNQAGGSISGAYIGVTILGGSGRVTNAGRISDGVYLAGGGSLTNSAGASTSGNNFGVFVGVGPGTVTNDGSISSTSNNGIYLQAGGSVTNSNGGSISGPGFGVAVYGGPGTVTNSGTISGGDHAVLFANSGANRLVVDSTAVFNGSVLGGSGSNTLELAGGKGSIANLSDGSGKVTENGSWNFSHFGTIAVDPSGDWTLNGGTVANVSNNGTVGIAGSLHVSSALDPASTGVFLLTDGAKFDIAAALGTDTRMEFLGSSELSIDGPNSFGRDVGRASYAGPQLQDFGAGNIVDLKQFGSTGTVLQFDSATGILQVTNSASQHASLSFQTSSLGNGTFHAVSDGGSGTLITLG